LNKKQNPEDIENKRPERGVRRKLGRKRWEPFSLFHREYKLSDEYQFNASLASVFLDFGLFLVLDF
jgi:hypothetical protein